MSVFATTLFSEIDFERDGKQVARLNLPYSVTRSAYGVIPIPLAVIKNGEGPTIFLMAGNHGDEYEGQIALGNLIRELEPGQVTGRIIILPSANLPAARAGQRVSTLDGANLNRVFPADPSHGPTHEIAHYIEHHLMPMADIFVDLHSGGGSLNYIPYVSASITGDVEQDRRAYALMRAFGGPYGHIWNASDIGAATGGSRTAGGAALRQGALELSGEFGGGAVVEPKHLHLVERGVRNLLAQAGVLPGVAVEDTGPMRLMADDRAELFSFSPDYGVFVPAAVLGDEVKKGDLVGTIHNLEHPERDPIPVRFRASGLLICLRVIGRVEPGDCLGHLAVDVDEPQF
jgi:predicted deacylase